MKLKWLLLPLFWIVFTIILLEGGFRLVGRSLPGQLGLTARYVMTGSPYAEDWTPAWRENRDHYYTLRPNLENVLQYGTASVSFRLTTHKLFTTDDGLPPDEGIGFRTRPVDYQVDTVVVGDSFGFCFTEEADCWVNILAQNTQLGIANLSQPVTGTISHAKILKDFAAPLQPPLVIWQFFGNDFNDDYGLLTWRGDIEPIEDQTTVATDTATDTNIGLVDWLRHNSVAFAVIETALTGQWGGLPETQTEFVPQYTVTYADNQIMQFGKPYERQALDMSRPANQYGLEQSRQAFVESKTLVERWGGKIVVVIIPTREEVYANLTEPIMGKAELDKQRSARLAMLDLCTELELTCIDPLADFQQRALNGEALYYNDDMHLNPAGNAALAAAIQTWLTDSGSSS